MGAGKKIPFHKAQIQMISYPSITAGRLPTESTYIYTCNNKYMKLEQSWHVLRKIKSSNVWDCRTVSKKDTGLKVEGNIWWGPGVRQR